MSEDDGLTAECGFAGSPLARVLADERVQPVLLLVEGAAGQGKSHLLQELADLPGTADATRSWWRCGAGGGPPRVDEDPNTPTLWLVDDAHRAKGGELRLLRRMLEGLRPGSAAVVAYRPEELPVPGLPLGDPPMTYPSRMTVLRHRLEPWDEAHVRRAAGRTLGAGCSADMVRRLHELTGGVPGVVVDLLAELRQRRPAFGGTAAGVESAGVPVRLAELVLSRTRAPAPEDRPVVWAAAVLDGPVGRDELLAVSGLGTVPGNAALLRALEEAHSRNSARTGTASPSPWPPRPCEPPCPDPYARTSTGGRRRPSAAGSPSPGPPWPAITGDTVTYVDRNGGPDTVITGLATSSVCVEGGDSGGAYISGNQARGMTSGGPIDQQCTGGVYSRGSSYFQPLDDALSYYGLTLNSN